VNARDLAVFKREGAAGLERLAQEKKARSRRPAKVRAPGVTKELREAAEAAFYAVERGLAFARAGRVVDERGNVKRPARCEVHTNGQRCSLEGVDPDHVLGGAYKSDCEALGAEGLEIMCRVHHDMKTANSPSRFLWLDQAKEHAIRIGAKRLLQLVEKAIARHEAKHGDKP
jgi:predicted transcriptional regulator